MKKRRDQSGVKWLVFSGIVVFLSPIAVADEVTLIPGATLKQASRGRVLGQVTSESAAEVVLQLGANTITVPASMIQSIRYDGQSASFLLGESRASGGQLAEAAELFRKAATESSAKPLAARAAQFREAEVLSELALTEPERSKEARDKLARFIRQNPESRQIGSAQECIARLQLSTGDFAGAQSTIAALAKLPGFDSRAAVLRTRLLARQGKNADAITELDKLIASYPKESEQRRAAVLAKAENLAGLKQYKEAEALVREVIAASPAEDAGAQATAYNALGDCMRAAKRPKEALIAYLHTDLLYSKDKEEHPRALYHIQALFRELKQDGHAEEFAQRLKQEYPHSPWLKAKEGQ
jgi:TolA-binding protein